MEILHKITDECIFKSRHKTLLRTVETAVKQGISLMRADLRGADLRRCDLRDSDLRDSDLREADLRGCDLRGCDLRRCDLRDSDLRDSDLRGCDLRRCDLRDSDLRDSDLRRAYLRGADLGEADLKGADLRGAKNVLCISPIGSRGDALYAVIHPKTVMIKTGCWWGDIKNFQAAVKKTHNNNECAQEYFAAITFITQWAELQNKEEDKI